MEDIKKKVEALLFSSGRMMSVDELCKICRGSPENVLSALNSLKEEYSSKEGSLFITNEAGFWKLTTKDEYAHLVKNIVTQTELTKTLMETLAVIAFKYPIKQSDLIKVRTNKAYDHLLQLEEMGYITRQKYGRTKLIKLAQRFFDYFSLPQDKLKEQFRGFEDLAVAIEAKEDEIKKIRHDQKKQAEASGKVALVDEKGHKVALQVVDAAPETEQKPESESADIKIESYGDQLGKLEIVDEPEEKEEPAEEETASAKPASKGIEISAEAEDKVDERVREILGGMPEEEAPAKPEEDAAAKEDAKIDAKIEELLHPKDENENGDSPDNSKWGYTEKEKVSLGVSGFKKPEIDSEDEPDDKEEQKDDEEKSDSKDEKEEKQQD